jgi:pyruvate ferredoxin oxidoreductase alpha subunit
MGARDSGWIQIYAENNQEAYDNFLMAMPIGETPAVRLPVMSCMDGFITSHAVENIELLETEAVRRFIGEYNPENYLLKKENPLAVGPYDVSPYYMEHKVQEAEAMKAARARILEVAAAFEKISGRHYGLIEEYSMEDAELALVLIGSSAGTAKAAVDRLRENGVKAGLVKIRVFRPFPGEELARALAHTRAVAVMDKSEGFSANGGPIFAETCSALYNLKERPYLVNIVYGLGGRDVKTEDIEKVFGRLADIAVTGETGPVYTHMGQRSKEEIV